MAGFKNFFRFTRGKLPGPGAAEFAFQRKFYDPYYSPIGAGCNAGSLDVVQPGVVVIQQAAILIGLNGNLSGQYMLQPLLDSSGETV